MAEIAFWTFIGLCIYTYMGYPLLIGILASLRQKPVRKGPVEPMVSFITVARNEEEVIEKKVLNTLSLDYPKDKLQLIFASDGSTDRTVEILNLYREKGVEVLACKGHRGKAATLNDAVSMSRGEIIVFSDARQEYRRDAIRKLVSNFSDPQVGAVGGELILLKEGDEAFGTTLAAYWGYEKFIRDSESKVDSTIGVSGAIWAIRKGLFEPFPQGLILDDLYLPMRVVMKGYRVVFEREALAFDRVNNDPVKEFRRKVRTLAGNWQCFFKMKGLFNPFRNRVCWQFVSHKVLRVLFPFFTAGAFVTNLFLLSDPFYRGIFYLQCAFYLLCLLSLISHRLNLGFHLLNLFHTFAILNYSAFMGFLKFLTGKHRGAWK